MTRMPAMARPPRVRIVYLDRTAIATEIRRPAFEHFDRIAALAPVFGIEVLGPSPLA